MKKTCLTGSKLTAIFILINLLPSIYAQDFILGIQYGYGTTSYFRQSDNHKTKGYMTQQASLITGFSPYYSHLFVFSGIAYEMNRLNTSLSIPLTLRIVLGETIRPYAEFGGYYNYLLESNTKDFAIKNDLGAKVAVGLLVNLNKHWRMDLGYNYRFGFTKALEEEILLPLGQVLLEEYRRKSGLVCLSVKYRF